jgi:hypothetical protein
MGDRQQNDSHLGATQTTYQLVGVYTQHGRIHWYSTGGVSMLERAFNCVMAVVATLCDIFHLQ